MTRPFDDYAKLLEEVSPNEAERALSHFIIRMEKGLAIPPNLQNFILKGLKRQRDTDSGGGFASNVGRPIKTDEFTDYLQADSYPCFKAWYAFHLNPSFNSFPKTSGNGRAVAVAKHIGSSETGVKRDVKAFAELGFSLPPRYSDEDARELGCRTNQATADIFDRRCQSDIVMLGNRRAGQKPKPSALNRFSHTG